MPLGDQQLRQEYKELGPISRDEIIVASVQIIQFAGLLSRRDLINNYNVTRPADLSGVNDATIACAAAIVLFFIPSSLRPGEPILSWDTVEYRLPWGVLILMGGGFAIANGFQASQLTKFIGEQIAQNVTFDILPLTFVIMVSVCLLTEVTSNVATAGIMLPIMASVSNARLMNPLALMLPATVACSCAFMLPAATPPNSVVFATGRVSLSDMVKAGSVMNLLAAPVVGMLVYIMGARVFHTLAPFPEWACLPETCAWLPVSGEVQGEYVSSQACLLLEGDTCRLYNGTVLNISAQFG